MEVESVEKLVLNRKKWKEMIQNRMKFLQSFDQQKGRKYEKSQGKLISLRGAKKRKKTKSNVFMKDVGDFFVQKRVLTIYQKRKHRKTDEVHNFTYSKCGENFKQEGAWKNHQKHCRGSRVEGKKKEWKERKKSGRKEKRVPHMQEMADR